MSENTTITVRDIIEFYKDIDFVDCEKTIALAEKLKDEIKTDAYVNLYKTLNETLNRGDAA